jgi:hypothetical protein
MATISGHSFNIGPYGKYEVDHLKTIHAMFALNWHTGFRGEELNIFSIGPYVKIKSSHTYLKSNMAARAHYVFWLAEILKIFLLETTKPIELWLCRNDHWVVLYYKDHSCHVCIKLAYWFHRNCFLNIFLGSYVKTMSADGGHLGWRSGS